MTQRNLLVCAALILVCGSTVDAQGSLDQRVNELSQQIATKMSAKQKTTIAVVEFTDLQGRVTDFGRFLAEELITRIYDTEKFKVIERQQLNKVIAEQKLSLTGMVDPASAKQLGRLLGVDAIASGTYSDLSQSLKVNARLISTEIFAVASTEIFKDESVTRLLGSGTAAQVTPTNSSEKKPFVLGATNSTVPQRASEKDFSFQLHSCRMTGGTVTCQMTITNDASVDRELQLNANWGSRMFDQFGNEYIATGAELGTRADPAWVKLVLVPQVPTKAMVKFEKVSPEASTMRVLRLSCSASNSQGWGYVEWNVDFRNVAISK